MQKLNLVRVLMAVSLVVTAGICVFLLPVRDTLRDLLEWVTTIGDWGPVVLAAAYTPAAVLFIPGSLLTLGGGFAFGFVRGTIAASLGSTLGATAAFLVSRSLGREWLANRFANNVQFAAIDEAVAKEGFKIVFLTRLSPVLPFNLLNYMFGLTQVRLRDFVLASWVGMLPGTFLYISLGHATKDIADILTGRVTGGTAQNLFFLFGLIVTVVVTVVLTRIAKRALNQALNSPGRHGDPDMGA